MRTSRLISVLAALLSVNPLPAEEPKGKPSPPISLVTSERLRQAEKEPGNWLMYSGQYTGQRHCRLDQINDRNVHALRVKWVRQFPTQIAIETSPLVVDGVMYATLPENELVALDARTGLRYWSYKHPLPRKLAICCGKVNRGVAILGETLYMGTLDGHLLARDARSGRERWKVEVAPGATGHSITSAPLVVKDMVVTGIAGGEYGIRGFVAAYDARTGKQLWRTYTIPGKGEPDNDTWEGDSWKTGGSPAWVTGAYDPELNLIYWGVGNPGPDWNGEARKGDNLYSDCVLALDADAGRIKAYFQFTPHDVHDWDACQVPVLVDGKIGGKQRKLLLTANRNAFYYVLDRAETLPVKRARDMKGPALMKYYRGLPFAKQTWAEPLLTGDGRPIRKPNTLPSKEGTEVYPDVSGATNWWSPTYSPQTNLFYVMAFDGAGKYYIGKAEHKAGQPFLGGIGTSNSDERTPDPSYRSAVRALDPTTGTLRWEYPVHPKSTSGLLSTQGNLVFGGTAEGDFFALDARSGKELWRLDLGGRVHAAPVSYLVGGKQYVTIAAGSALFTLGL
jgi:alcohol dehydrogenase (cytochrome c)